MLAKYRNKIITKSCHNKSGITIWGTNFSQFMASLVNLSPAKVHFTTKHEKELNVNNSLPRDTLTFMEPVYSPHPIRLPTRPPLHELSWENSVWNEKFWAVWLRSRPSRGKCLCKRHPRTLCISNRSRAVPHLAALPQGEAHPISPPIFSPTGPQSSNTQTTLGHSSGAF